jgi:tetratricopeptide (TPR) repeat protein
MIPPSLRLLLTAIVCLMAVPALANKPKNITKAEMALIPKYCPDTMGFGYGDAHFNTSPRAPHWVSMLGKDFWNLHHYCWALINLSRANRFGIAKQLRNGILQDVLNDYRYVLDRAEPDFILAPEILTRVGEAELKLARPERADDAFARARQIKPDYWPAYSHWIEYLIAKGRRSEAKSLAQEGLEYSPKVKTLQEQYRLLGGDPALIVPKPPPLVQSDEAEPAATLPAD